jgi:hypothetical protein
LRACFRARNLVARQPAVPRNELHLVQTIYGSSPSEFLRLPLPLLAFRRRAIPTKSFCPHRGIVVAVHFARGPPNPHYVPPSGFLSLSTACSGPDSTGLFHPAATSRVLPVQGLPASCSRPASSATRAPLPLSARPSPSSRTIVPKGDCSEEQSYQRAIVPKNNGRAPRPRLRGFAPQEVAFLGLGDQPPRRSLPSSGSVLPQELSPRFEFRLPETIRS